MASALSPQWTPASNTGPSPSSSRSDRPLRIKIPPALSHSSSTPTNNTPQYYSYSKSLVLRNLHREIFKNASDVLPLLEPFGVIQRIRLAIPSATSTTPNADRQECPIPTASQKTQALPPPVIPPTEESSQVTSPAFDTQAFSQSQNHVHASAVVEFTNPFDVPVAVAALDGQIYGDIAVCAERIPQHMSISPRAEFDTHLEAGVHVHNSGTYGGLNH